MVPVHEIVCFPPSPWRTIPTRTQQFMTRLKDAQVLLFEPAPSPLSKTRRGAYRKPGRNPRPNVTVYTLPPVLPAREGHPFLARHNRQKLSRYVLRQMARHRVSSPLLWCATPQAAPLIDLVPHRSLVYDCDRNWTDLPIQWESDLAYQADVIFAASKAVADKLSPCNDNIALLPNGANSALFDRADDPTLPIPGDLVSIPAPILGYAGTIWPQLDLEPVEYAARLHPEWSFVFVGRGGHNPGEEALRALPNVYFLGKKAPEVMPEYVARFDVCLSLLRTDWEESDVLSTRIYEYLSTGRPIVSMYNPYHDEEYPSLIYSAYSPERFAQMCADALAEPASSLKPDRRRAAGAAASWTVRTQEVRRILTSALLF